MGDCAMGERQSNGTRSMPATLKPSNHRLASCFIPGTRFHAKLVANELIVSVASIVACVTRLTSMPKLVVLTTPTRGGAGRRFGRVCARGRTLIDVKKFSPKIILPEIITDPASVRIVDYCKEHGQDHPKKVDPRQRHQDQEGRRASRWRCCAAV